MAPVYEVVVGSRERAEIQVSPLPGEDMRELKDLHSPALAANFEINVSKNPEAAV